MKTKALVISASAYRITDDKTGAVEAEGVTVRYVATENLAPFEDEKRNIKGYKPSKANMPYDYFPKFGIVPAVYEVTYTTNVDSQGRTTLKETDFTFLNEITVNTKSAAAIGGKLSIL